MYSSGLKFIYILLFFLILCRIFFKIINFTFIHQKPYKMILPTLADIKAAHTRIKPFIHKTPVMTSSLLNEHFNCELFFKCENFQKVGAFKFRGATNAVLSLTC